MNESTELKGRYSDFIGEYSCVFSTEYCDEIIRCFDYYQDIDAVYCGDEQFDTKNAGRFDWALDLYDMGPMTNGPVSQQMNKVLFECLEEYTTVFGHLSTVPFYSLAQKIQKTPAGGGYHVWHDENSYFQEARRSLVWMVYLNDDYEGGETEYLYYKKRIQPERGKLLIWPAGITHCHRGGLVLKGNKYVATGWFYLGGMNYGREE